MLRRRFLQHLALTPVLGLRGAANRDTVKHLLLDSRLIERVENAHLKLGEVRKDPHNPLFIEDKPWEVEIDNLYGNVLFDKEEGIYKCWYSPFVIYNLQWTGREWLTPKEGARTEMAVCYATSRDGIAWQKPDLGLVAFQGSKNNNIVKLGPHGAGILKEPHDPDSSRRYKMFFLEPGAGGTHRSGPSYMSVSFSPDGLRWSKDIPCPEIQSVGDTHNNCFWDERSGKYIGFTRLWSGDGKAGRRQRIVGRCESRDFLKWTRAVDVLHGDLQHQTYAMPVFPYAGVYLGLLMVFDTSTDFVDCELAWSPDTVRWERVCPGCSLIPRGPKGSFDHGCIYGAAYPISRDGELKLYYGGSDWGHSGQRAGCLCLAHLRMDGFAGMEPKTARGAGSVLTRPLECVGKNLRISADARGGELRVAVRGAEGLGLDDCNAITENVTDSPVTWREGRDLMALQGQRIQLQFELKAAKLYSLSFTGA